MIREEIISNNSVGACIVIAEGWPSWLTGVMATGFDIELVISGMKQNKKFFPHVSNKQWKPYSYVEKLSPRNEKLIFISGSVAFVENTLSYVDNHKIVILIEGNQPHRRTLQRMDSVKWERIKHWQCGGITNGQFWFGWKNIESKKSVASQPARYLLYILSPTARGFQSKTEPPDNINDFQAKVVRDKKNIILPCGLAPIENMKEVFACPSVFTDTKWCHRKLTINEVGDAFDQTQSIVEECVLKHLRIHNLPFINGIPNKVVQYVLRRLSISKFISVQTQSKEIDKGLPVIEVPPDIQVNHLKAVKADNAQIETWVWDERVLKKFPFVKYDERVTEAFNKIRRGLLRMWKRKVWSSFFKYLTSEYGADWKLSTMKHDSKSELFKDIQVFVDCAYASKNSTWFEWPEGSCLFFWRWQTSYRSNVRDGIPYWFKGPKPRAKKPQSHERDDAVRLKVREKLSIVRRRGYIRTGFVKSLIRYFSVPKGDNDVRMVYDGTSSGFNRWVWAPSFGLPTVETMLRSVEHRTWLGDIDVGEQFLNFPLDPRAQLYCGVDLTPYFPEELKDKKRIWERWTRCLMGAKPSPYQAIRSMLWSEDIVRGDRNHPSNPFRWSHISLNLPGSGSYDPTRPWVAKTRADGAIACDFYIYVDDVRITGPSEDEIWNAIRKISSIFGYLGIQDAARKRRPPTTRPGAWAGSMIYVDPNNIGVYVDHDKWQKTKDHLEWIETQLNNYNNIADIRLQPNAGILHKELEKRRGFLVYISRTYPSMTPYLKGIHQTLDSWRPGRDGDGWRLTMAEIKEAIDKHDEIKYSYPSDAPTYVIPANRLEDDLKCLKRLFESEHPRVRHVRTNMISYAYYGFGDASESGFGSSIERESGLKIRHGIWGRDSNKLSSNYRELRNLVETVEEEVQEGKISGSELFIFTDNSVAEGCYYKGTSQSRMLFNLVLRLRKAEHDGGLKLHVMHVSGKRMIAQGTDGLSRGNFLEGVLAGQSMKSFVPLHLSAIERSRTLVKWLKSWIPSDKVTVLKSEDWFTLGHGVSGGEYNADKIWIPTYDTSCKIWAPAPAASFEAITELIRARHMEPYVSHIFVCPRLFTNQWRKNLLKLADTVFYVGAGAREFWDINMFEPLIIGIALPFRNHPPWQLRQSEQILALERELRTVWKDSPGNERYILRKFWK